MLAEHGEDFAGHEGIEMHDAAIAHFHPFRMAARQPYQQVSARLAREGLQNTEDLGLFAAHHVRQVRTLNHTRHDMHIDATQTAHGLQGGSEIGNVGRRIAVGRFAPALGAADHAAGDHRQIGLSIEPVRAGLVESQLKTVGAFTTVDDSWRLGQLHDPRRQRTLFENPATFGKFVST
ncbi:hypothetical protein D3C87_1572460 [compost metagenome]